MKSINVIISVLFLIFINCKQANNKPLSYTENKTRVLTTKINDTVTVKNDSAIVFLSPSNSEIKVIKREKGDDSFYTIADDENYYRANINELLNSKKYAIEIVEKRFIKFGKNDKVIDKNNIPNKWAVLIYVKGKPLSIISSVDLYIKLNELKNRNRKINYNSILEQNSINVSENEVKPISNGLNGIWRVDCRNGLTVLSISNSDAYMSIYSNTIYINAKIKSIIDEPNNYLITFLNQEGNYQSGKNKIDESSISKEKNIGRLEFKNNQLTLIWYGLYNEVTKQKEFIDKDFVMIRENGGVSPVILKRCDE